MDTILIEIPNDKKEMKIFQEKMNDVSKQYRKEVLKIKQELDISYLAALDVWGMRNSNAYTPEVEELIIQKHKEGNPININDLM